MMNCCECGLLAIVLYIQCQPHHSDKFPRYSVTKTKKSPRRLTSSLTHRPPGGYVVTAAKIPQGESLSGSARHLERPRRYEWAVGLDLLLHDIESTSIQSILFPHLTVSANSGRPDGNSFPLLAPALPTALVARPEPWGN